MAQLANTNGTKSGGRKITGKMMEWSVSWAKEEITTAELGRRFHLDPHHVNLILYRAASSLREAVKAGLLK